jgi:hypothetical protein
VQPTHRILDYAPRLQRRPFVVAAFGTVATILFVALLLGIGYISQPQPAGDRESACRTSFHLLAYALSRYAEDHDRTYPDSLNTLCTKGYFPPNRLVIRSGAGEVESTTGLAVTDRAEAGGCVLLYIGAGADASADPPRLILRQLPLRQGGEERTMFSDGTDTLDGK